MIALGVHELHVWTAAPPGRPDDGAICNAEERARAARFVRPQDRDAFLHARGALRVVLGHYLDAAPGAIEFASGPWGKPELAGPFARRGFAFNLSHAGGLALIAVARERAVGIDVERVRAMPEALAIADRVIGARGAAGLEHLDPRRRDLAFLRLWTAHEACIKALGRALAVAGEAVRIGWAGGSPVCDWADPGAAPDGLDLVSLATAPGHVAALAWTRRPAADAGPAGMNIARFDYAASLADC